MWVGLSRDKGWGERLTTGRILEVNVIGSDGFSNSLLLLRRASAGGVGARLATRLGLQPVHIREL